MTTPEFMIRLDCKSHAHCRACRNEPAWRHEMFDAFGPFECPYNLPIGADEKLIHKRVGKPVIKKLKMSLADLVKIKHGKP